MILKLKNLRTRKQKSSRESVIVAAFFQDGDEETLLRFAANNGIDEVTVYAILYIFNLTLFNVKLFPTTHSCNNKCAH
jgi:hypothetical protein